MDANQRVAANVRRLRIERGLTQEEAAEWAAPHLHKRLSKASWSALERSVDGTRIKSFDANELEALARAFKVDVTELLHEAAPCSHCGGTGFVQSQ